LADDLPPLKPGQRQEAERLTGYVLGRFGLPDRDVNRYRIVGQICELLLRGFKSEQIEEVVAWAVSPKAGKGTPQSAVSATDPLRFGQWLTTRKNHIKEIEAERKRRNR
jgi:hypothetical protein